MLKLLQKSYPLLESKAARWRMCLVFSVFVGLFLFVFEPFGIGNSPGPMWLNALAYAGVCLVLMFALNILLVPVLPGLFRESTWTTGHQIFWTMLNVLVIGFGNLLLTSWLFNAALDWDNFVTFEAYTLAIGFFPVTVSFVLNQIRLERHYQHSSERLNLRLTNEQRNTSDLVEVRLTSDNQGEDLQLQIADFVLAIAADNYVEVYYRREGTMQKILLRTTLRRLEAELAGHQDCWRCHKSYLVNSSYVNRFSGNAQGYKLHLSLLGTLVPVSRGLHQELHPRFGV